MQNEVVQADAQGEQKQIRSTDWASIEKVVSEYAMILAAKARVNPNHIEIHLARNLGAIMKIQGGPSIKIFLQWPEAQPNINTLLGDAFNLVKKYPIRRSMEIVPVAYIRTEREEIRKKWRKEKFTDESEIILDLIPRHRLRVIETHTTRLFDVVTGESISVTREGPTDRFDGDSVGLWLDLSRIVRDKWPEEDLPDDEPAPKVIQAASSEVEEIEAEIERELEVMDEIESGADE